MIKLARPILAVLMIVGLAFSVYIVHAQGEIVITSTPVVSDDPIRLTLPAGETSGSFVLYLHNTSDVAIDNVTLAAFIQNESGQIQGAAALEFLTPDAATPPASFSVPAQRSTQILFRITNLVQPGVFDGTIRIQRASSETPAEGSVPAEITTQTFTLEHPGSSQIKIQQADANQLITLGASTRSFEFALTLVENQNEVDIENLKIEVGPLTRKDGDAGPDATIRWASNGTGEGLLTLPKHGVRALTLSGELPELTTYQGWLSLGYGDHLDTYTLEIARSTPTDLVIAESSNNALALKFAGNVLRRSITLQNPAGNPAIDDLQVSFTSFGREDGEPSGQAVLSCSLCDGNAQELPPGATQSLVVEGSSLEATKYVATLRLSFLDKEQVVAVTIEPGAAPTVTFQDIDKLVINGQTGERIVNTVNVRETGNKAEVIGLQIDVGSGDLRSEDTRNAIKLGSFEFSHDDGVKAGDFTPITISLDLTGAQPGAYTGKLWVTSDNAAAISTDLEINVRHSPFWPAVVLIASLAITIGVSTYLQQGKPRDDLLIRIDRLKIAIAHNMPEAFTAFANEIREKVNLAANELDKGTNANLQQASGYLDEADQLHRRWLDGSSAYPALYDEIKAWIQTITTWKTSGFLDYMKQYLERVQSAKIAQYTNVDEMRRDKTRIVTALNQYNRAWTLLENRRADWAGQCLEKTKHAEITLGFQDLESVLSRLGAPTIDETNVNTPVQLPSDLTDFNSKVHTLEQQASTAKSQADEAYTIYSGCRDEVRRLLPQIGESTVKARLEQELSTARTLVADSNRIQVAEAAKRAENSWYVAYEEVYVFSKAREKVGDLPEAKRPEAVQTLNNLNTHLASSANYALEIQAFRDALKPHITAAVAIIRIVDENFTDPAVPRTPEGAANWDDVDRTHSAEDDEIDVKDDLAEHTGVSPHVPGQDNLLMRLLSRLAPAPKARRWLFDILTLVIAVVVLFLTAWKEKYVDVNTFGSFSNYVDLALWGFGVGAARQAVVTMAKGWGIALP